MANNVATENSAKYAGSKNTMTNNKNGKVKKKGHKGLIISLVVFLLLVSLAACYVLNIGQVKDKVSNIFVNKQTEAQAVVNEDNQKLLKVKQDKLDKKEAELNAKATELADKEKELQDMQTKLNTLKDELNGQQKEYKSISKIYETMDSESAAKILSQYSDKNEVSQILMQLSNAKSAEILAAMDPSFASQILKMSK